MTSYPALRNSCVDHHHGNLASARTLAVTIAQLTHLDHFFTTDISTITKVTHVDLPNESTQILRPPKDPEHKHDASSADE